LPHPQIPCCPAALARILRVVPLAPLSLSLTACCRQIGKRHPGLFRRLGDYSRARFVLNPVDLPIILCLAPNGGAPTVRALRGDCEGETRISGPLAALLGLVHGVYDGDALFFSRDLVIEGDTGAALALRNAVDDAELDLSQEIAAVSGPFGRFILQTAALAERRTGLCLARPEEDPAW
jgi:predicted lipid carrier protein YhbT